MCLCERLNDFVWSNTCSSASNIDQVDVLKTEQVITKIRRIKRLKTYVTFTCEHTHIKILNLVKASSDW